MSDKPHTAGIQLRIDDGDYILTTEALENKMMPLLLSDEQREADVAYINGLIEADEQRKAAPAPGQPTPGLRIEVRVDPAGRDHGDILYIATKDGQYNAQPRPHFSKPAEITQAGIDAVHINNLLEADERRRAHFTRQANAPDGQHDLMVDLGDMSAANFNQIALDAEYEAMVEDIIGNVNHIVLQGTPPIRAVFAMSQAFAIVLGYALRANMNFDVAKAMITQVMQSATKNEKLLRIITKQ